MKGGGEVCGLKTMRRDKKINKTMRLILVTYKKQGDANRRVVWGGMRGVGGGELGGTSK